MATQRKIGATIQLDGERQFKSAVTQATSALKTMSSEMKLLSVQFAGQENTLTALTAKHALLDKQLKQSQEIETKTAEALANAQKNYDKAGKSLGVYQENLAKAEKELEALRKSGTATEDVIEEQEAKVTELARAVQAGERAYDRAGQNVQSWSQKLNSAKIDTINLSRQIEENDKLMDEAAASADGCAHSIDGYGKKVKEVAQDTAEGVQVMTDHMDTFFTVDKIRDFANEVSATFKQVADDAYSAAIEIDKGYDAIIKKSGATGDALVEMKEIADNLYTDMPVDMTKIGNSIGEVSTRFHLQGDELERVSEIAVKFAELNNTDVVSSIDSCQNMMSAFGESIENVDRAYDVMNKTGQETGVNLSNIASKVTENAAAFQELGMDLYQSIDFMGKLETSGADASTVLSGMKRALKSATEDGKSFGEALADMEDRIKNGTDSMDGLNAAYELFGKSGAGIYTAVKTGSLSFRELADSQKIVADSAGSVAQTYENTLDAWDEITKAQHAFQQSGAALAGEVLKELTPAITKMAGGISDLTKWYKELPRPMKLAVTGLSAFTVGIGVALPKAVSLYTTLKAFQTIRALPLKDIAKSIKGITDASKGASAVANMADAVDDVTDAAKGASTVADVADSIDDVTDAARGASSIGNVSTAIDGVASSSTAATTAVKGLSVATQAFIGAGIAVAGFAAVGVVVDKLHDKFIATHQELKDLDDYVDHLTSKVNTDVSEVKDVINNITDDHTEIELRNENAQPLIDQLKTLQNKSDLTNQDLYTMEKLCKQLNAIYPELGLSVNEFTGQLEHNGEVVKDISKITDDYYKTAKETAKQNNYQGFVDAQVKLEADKTRLLTEYETVAKKREELQNAFRDKYGTGAGAIFHMGGWNEDWRVLSEYTLKLKDLEDSLGDVEEAEKDLNSQQEYWNEELGLTDTKIKGMASSMAVSGQSVANLSTKYEELAKKVRDAGGMLTDADFAEDEAELQELYQKTIQAWQEFHDEFTSGLSDEVLSLSGAMTKWTDYHDAVSDALKSNADMFNEFNHNEEISWDSMTQNLDSNVSAYERWNQNVDSILKSVRYQTDEDFRAMANSIMSMGIQGSDYLQQFVDNVANDVDLGLGDLARFGELAGVEEQYATTMANLQIATENGMNGIASAYDNTASQAELSLQSLYESLDQQAQMYTDWYNNVEKLTQSDRYQSDESFREFANNVLSYGTAGADMLDTLVQAMDEGSSELDDVIGEYMTLKGADEKAAQAQASIQTQLQEGFNQQVAVVDNAQSALSTAFGNYADAGVEGFETRFGYLDGVLNGAMTTAEQAFNDHKDTLTGAAQTMTDDMTTSVENGTTEMLNTIRQMMNDFIVEVFGLGEGVGDSFGKGVASSLGNSKNVSPYRNDSVKQGVDKNVTINMTVNGSEGQDPNAIAGIAVSKMQGAWLRGVANYGY